MQYSYSVSTVTIVIQDLNNDKKLTQCTKGSFLWDIKEKRGKLTSQSQGLLKPLCIGKPPAKILSQIKKEVKA